MEKFTVSILELAFHVVKHRDLTTFTYNKPHFQHFLYEK